MTSREPLDDLVAHMRRQRVLARMASEIRDSEFWRRLNPELTVSDGPITSGPARLERLDRDRVRNDAAMAMALAQLTEEGYCQLPPRFDPDAIAPLRVAIERIVALGLPANFVWVYDDVYALFARACEVMSSVLGPRPWFVPRECWAFHVEAGDPASTRWSAFGPHRDRLCVDAGVLAHSLPTVLTIWIPLVDVTTLDSCIYVVPAPGDADYFTAQHLDQIQMPRLQDVRALPAPAGAILAWTTHLVHWGSRSSQFASGPRISVTGYFQRRDQPRYGTAVDLDGPIAFSDRVDWIHEALESGGALAAGTVVSRDE